jgi:hypothetical protein
MSHPSPAKRGEGGACEQGEQSAGWGHRPDHMARVHPHPTAFGRHPPHKGRDKPCQQHATVRALDYTSRTHLASP